MSLKGTYAVDTGPLLEMMRRSSEGDELFNAVMAGTIVVITHELAIVELKYLLCRALGREEAYRRVYQLLSSGFIAVDPLTNLVDEAAAYKCRRGLALPDCFSLSLGKSWGIPVLFGGFEKELISEMNNDSFDVKISFLSDLVK
jgi:predicted nucleic acid-binding protein